VLLIPPFVRDNLNLTEEQQKQIADLEKETTDKLIKILTPDQQKQLKEARPPRRPGGPDGGPPGKGGPPPDGPPPRDPEK
jgi:Spy/CpxP family protein refolding chaperone